MRDTKGKPIKPEKKESSDMVHMERTNSERRGRMPSEKEDAPDYPYGLRLHLDQDSMKKIGMKELPEIGEEIHIKAKANVASAAVEKREAGEDNRRMDLQITHLGIHQPEEKTEKREKKEINYDRKRH